MADHLTTLEANAIVVYADRCLKVLHLRHWAVLLAADPAAEEDRCLASIHTTDGRFRAMLHVAKDWTSQDEATRRATVMHECLHLIHAQLDNHTREVLADNTAVSRDIWDAFYDPFKMHIEYMVDHLTTVLQQAGLLPEWPSDKRVRRYMAKHGISEPAAG